ncbi:MAG: hypothetical protein GX915_05090 [Clostridiales bacterium]|nr:hypothetical protein [Clostridiales bacterium]
MGNAILMGQSGGGLKPDQVRAWKKYTIITEYYETSRTLTASLQIFSHNSGGAVGAAYFVPNEVTLSIDPLTGTYKPSEPFNSGLNRTHRALVTPFAGDEYSSTSYCEVTDTSLWVPKPNPPFGTMAPAGTKIYEINSQIKGDFIEIVYAKVGTYPDIGEQDGYWYELITEEFIKPNDAYMWMRFPLKNVNLNPQLPVNPVNNIEAVYPNGKLLVNLGVGDAMFVLGLGSIFSFPHSSDIGDVEVSSIFQYRSNSAPFCVEAKVNPSVDDFDIVYGEEGKYPNNEIEGDYFYVPVTEQYLEEVYRPHPGYIQSLVNQVTFSGTYGAELQARINAYGYNDKNQVLLLQQGANSTSYENIHFTISSQPSDSDIYLELYSRGPGTSIGAGYILYGALLMNVYKPINIECICNERNSTYDDYTVALAITYA